MKVLSLLCAWLYVSKRKSLMPSFNTWWSGLSFIRTLLMPPIVFLSKSFRPHSPYGIFLSVFFLCSKLFTKLYASISMIGISGESIRVWEFLLLPGENCFIFFNIDNHCQKRLWEIIIKIYLYKHIYIATFYFYHSNTLVVLSNIWITEGIIIGWFLPALVRGAPVILLNIVLLKLPGERVGLLVEPAPSFIIFDFLPLDFLFESILVRNLGFKGGYFLLLLLGSRELYLNGSDFLAVRDCTGSPSFNIILSSMLLRPSPPLRAWLLLAFVF